VQRLCALDEISIPDLVELVPQRVDVLEQVGGGGGLNPFRLPLEIGNAYTSRSLVHDVFIKVSSKILTLAVQHLVRGKDTLNEFTLFRERSFGL
jgi:hypothetical protein